MTDDKKENVNADIDTKEPVRVKINTQGARDPGKVTPDDLERIGKATQKISEMVRDFYNAVPIRDAMGEQLQTAADLLYRAEMTDGLPAGFFDTEVGQQVRKMLEGISTIIPFVPAFIRDLADMMPYIRDELKRKPYNGRTFSEVYQDSINPETGDIEPDSLYIQLITNARAARTRAGETRLKGGKVERYPIALDKYNSAVVFDLLRDADPSGQISMMEVYLGTAKNKEPLTGYYSLYFSDDLPPEISRKLTPFDRLVYGAIDAVQKVAGDYMTISQIHRAMGNKNDPNPQQTARIHDSIVKMDAAHIEIDNYEERKAYKINNDQRRENGQPEAYIDYYGSLCPMEILRKRLYMNGQVVEGAIHLLRPELPLITLAKSRNYQLEEIPIELLNSKLKQTDSNLAIQFFTLEQLLHIKNGKRGTHNKILYSTIYEKAGVKGTGSNRRKREQRARDTFFKYLDELVGKGFITGYKEETTPSTGEVGVTFTWAPKLEQK